MPEVGDFCLAEGFEGFFAKRFSEESKWVRKVISVTYVSNICKPVLVILFGVGKEFKCNSVENIATQVANHAKKCKLLEMEQSFTG